MAQPKPKVFAYAVEVDRGGRTTVPGGAQLDSPQGWSPDHFLLAALLRCAIDSLRYHARRAGHEARAAGFASGTVTRRDDDGRYAFVEIACRIDVELTPHTTEVADVVERAERDCFVAASLRVEPQYDWRIA